MSGKIFIISAPSGAGKTTLVNHLLEQLKRYPVERVITYTSRVPRPGERSGIDYHFISEIEFIEKIKQSFFLEYSTRYGTYYGCPRSIVEQTKQGISFMMIIDRIGTQKIIEQVPDAVLIWIHVEPELLRQRLIKRNADSVEMMEKRLIVASQEMAEEQHNPLYKYYINNDQLGMAIEQLTGLVLRYIE